MTFRKSKEDERMNVACIAERIVRETMIEKGVKKPDARRIVAKEAGVKPGTLERLCNGSLVHIERITDRINAYVVRRIERKIAQLESELAVARLASRRADEIDVVRAEAALDEARKALGI